MLFKPPWIDPRIHVVYVCIQVCHPRFEANKVLTAVCSCFGRVVAEAIVDQSRLSVKVLTLVEERDEADLTDF